MIYGLKNIINRAGGRYVADFREDEGLRIREEFISPTLLAQPQGCLSKSILIIEVMDKVKIKNGTKQGFAECKLGGVLNVAFPESKTRRGRVIDDGQTAPTLDTQCSIGQVTNDFRIRKLTPRECFRLQGFPDEYFERAAAVCSENQLYKQAGNSVTVNVIYEIAKRLKV